VVLETGCGVGNALLPLLTLNERLIALGCDLAPGAVDRANERLVREELAHRAAAFCWDLGQPPPRSAPLPRAGVDTVLAIFTLSALPPEDLPHAFVHLASCLRPGGQLLLRDYGRLDLKQLKFARAPRSARLGEAHGCEWYASLPPLPPLLSYPLLASRRLASPLLFSPHLLSPQQLSHHLISRATWQVCPRRRHYGDLPHATSGASHLISSHLLSLHLTSHSSHLISSLCHVAGTPPRGACRPRRA
jgi:SAM-dependent methyltransferase